MYPKCLYTKCIQHTTFRQTFVYILYTKCIHNICIQNVSHISTNFCTYTFCIQNLAGIALLIFYTKYIQKFVEMWYTFCIHFVYILYTSVVYILYNFVYKMYTQFPCVIFDQLASFNLPRPPVKFTGRKSSLDVGLTGSVGNSIFYLQNVQGVWCQ